MEICGNQVKSTVIKNPWEWTVDEWQKLYPENPITKEATTEEQAFKIIQNTLIERENFGDILLEFNN
ncbi:hypothetical protein H1P_1890008 [Hyella patelloides LEGE 07179]|uniref:Uncharacterized protein n=1 Tax=Hyella patelloides LEGE 07179 TaxID=945734 RepID=A0A563VP39_9CYAN|nr:hypothetical protein [Hyella patelloides]VEP13193.1 hypothetical protein H1P_1890008 [Hyella patelloides LEGE 07179]